MERQFTAGAAGGTAEVGEIERFRRIAQEWWDPDGGFRPLHRLNPVRAAYVEDALIGRFGRNAADARPLEGLRIVDVGCGGGLMSEAMAKLGADVLGVDAEAESIGVARVHAEEQGLPITYRCVTPEILAAEGARFDAVLAMEVIEHVADLDAFVAAVARLRADGGVVAFATLNRTLKSLALGKVAAEYVLRWVPRGTHQWRKFVRPSELAALLRRRGLRISDVTGFAYDPLTGGWSLSPDLSVNYAAIAEGD